MGFGTGGAEWEAFGLLELGNHGGAPVRESGCRIAGAAAYRSLVIHLFFSRYAPCVGYGESEIDSEKNGLSTSTRRRGRLGPGPYHLQAPIL